MTDALGLTPREAEVLALVARGYTNREIAATLVISAKRASVHVSHILRKLNAPNRRESRRDRAPADPTGRPDRAGEPIEQRWRRRIYMPIEW